VFVGVDHHQHLPAYSVKNFQYYADWRLKQFNITKQVTIWVEWKFLRLLYKREVGQKMDKLVSKEVSKAW